MGEADEKIAFIRLCAAVGGLALSTHVVVGASSLLLVRQIASSASLQLCGAYKMCQLRRFQPR